MCPFLESASSQAHHPEGRRPHMHMRIPGQAPPALWDARALAPNIVAGRSIVRNGPHLETSLAKEDLSRSARQIAPLFHGIFFKGLLCLRISFRVACVRCDFSPAMPGQHAVDRRCSYPTTNSFFISGMNRRNDKNPAAFSLFHPRIEEFFLLFKAEMSAPPSAPRGLWFGFARNLIANFPLHPDNSCFANPKNLSRIGVGSTTYFGNENTQARAQISRCFSIFSKNTGSLNSLLRKLCDSGH